MGIASHIINNSQFFNELQFADRFLLSSNPDIFSFAASFHSAEVYISWDETQCPVSCCV